MTIRDRIIDFRRVKASELRPSPSNWRTHPKAQREALSGILGEIGYADAVLAREVNGHLELIDGHCRRELTPDMEVPVLVTDLDDAEAAKLMTVLDPLAAMAEANKGALGLLLAGIQTDSAALEAMLQALADKSGIDRWEIGATDMPDLPDGDRAGFQQMTFTLSDEQVLAVKSALGKSKKAGPFGDTGNENSNGNALGRIVEAYLGTS